MKSRTPFFLTGGTALSRFYTRHRYSDDLDLFVSRDREYPKQVNKILQMLTEAEDDLGASLNRSSIIRGKDYVQLILIHTHLSDVE